MLDLLPSRALFRFELPIRHARRPPPLHGSRRDWASDWLVPQLSALEGLQPFCDVFMTWNEDGFYAAFHVTGRSGPLHCDPREWWQQDGLRLCIDTRDARDVKRGTRYCHFFYLLPRGGGRDKKQPVVGIHRMSRAKESPPATDLSAVRVAVDVQRDGYFAEVALPAGCLHGWDPVEHPRIGVFYKVKDTQLGSQTLSVTDDLGWNVDPSVWATGVLVS